MIVGTCLLDLRIPCCRSLKDKRQILKALKESIRRKYNISVVEIDHHDVWQRALIGIAAVSPNTKCANRVISKVVNAIEANTRVEVIDYQFEIR
ncbi:MAG: DUF503 domain-containing protein [bacterium]